MPAVRRQNQDVIRMRPASAPVAGHASDRQAPAQQDVPLSKEAEAADRFLHGILNPGLPFRPHAEHL